MRVARTRGRNKKTKVKYLILLIFLFAVIVTVADWIRISGYEIIPMRPAENIDLQQDQIYFQLENGETRIDWSRLDGTLQYISEEYDCADFNLVNLIRILYKFDHLIPGEYKTKIEDVLFNFRYWWDEPGENSMCYWSENHQILFASAEYLIGQKYPQTVFPNSGLTGKQHMGKARKRILDWTEMRWNYGFIEFYSSVYYKEDIGALVNLIDFAEDTELAVKSRIIMDLLFYDVASQNINTQFISVSGRAYAGNRKGGPGSTLGGLTSYYWRDGSKRGAGMLYGMMNTKYELPPVLAEIAKDTSDVIIRQSNGLDISELKTEGYYGTDNRSMMMQWGMECFSNPEIIRNSLAHIRNCNMFSNDFVGEFKILDYSVIKAFHLESLISTIVNPQSNGVAIQKGNTYTFKTKDFSMYTAQNYHPGTYGDQHHIFGMNVKNHFSIFHNHPAIEKNVKNQSPNYWVGYGRIPHSAQDEAVNLSIYSIPNKKGLMEIDLLDYTHAYFPCDRFDTVIVEQNYVFGKKEDTYCAMIGTNDFKFRDEAKDDLIQNGKRVFWITEAGSKKRDGSFTGFVQRIENNRIEFDPEELELNYQSNGNNYRLKFGEDFMINGEKIYTSYQRFDSPYIKANRKDKTFSFECNDKSLFLDFDNLTRQF